MDVSVQSGKRGQGRDRRRPAPRPQPGHGCAARWRVGSGFDAEGLVRLLWCARPATVVVPASGLVYLSAAVEEGVQDAVRRPRRRREQARRRQRGQLERWRGRNVELQATVGDPAAGRGLARHGDGRRPGCGCQAAQEPPRYRCGRAEHQVTAGDDPDAGQGRWPLAAAPEHVRC